MQINTVRTARKKYYVNYIKMYTILLVTFFSTHCHVQQDVWHQATQTQDTVSQSIFNQLPSLFVTCMIYLTIFRAWIDPSIHRFNLMRLSNNFFFNENNNLAATSNSTKCAVSGIHAAWHFYILVKLYNLYPIKFRPLNQNILTLDINALSLFWWLR